MIKNYLKIAFRNFRKKPINSFVIVSGLVISLVFCLLMFINNIHGEEKTLVQFDADEDLLSLLGLKVDWIEEGFESNKVAIINGAAANMIVRDSLDLITVGPRDRVVGVIEEVSLIPFDAEYEYFYIYPKAEERRLRQTFVKIQAGQLEPGLKKLEAVWSEVFPNNFFSYTFLDEYIAQHYGSYKIMTNLINFITVLGVVISCLGLFALNGIIAQNKLKEIGIRKILGASIRQIMILLNIRVLLIIIISGLVSIPISYQFMNKWLLNFSEHVYLGWYYFAIAIFIGLGVSLIIVSIQTIKAAYVNPVLLIKEE